MSVKSYSTGSRGFFQWLKARQPRVYADVAKKLGKQLQLETLSGLGDDSPVSSTPMLDTIAETLQKIVGVGAQAYLTNQQMKAQNSLMQTQLTRAQQGLSPLDLDPAVYGLQPTARVGLTGDTKTLLMWGGGLLAAVLLLPKLLRGRR